MTPCSSEPAAQRSSLLRWRNDPVSADAMARSPLSRKTRNATPTVGEEQTATEKHGVCGPGITGVAAILRRQWYEMPPTVDS
jgi:hypothetical protein